MKKGLKLLDCTLRDGGYYTNWDFDKQLVKDYCSAMESLPIDYVEIGYRSVELDGYLGEYFYCPVYKMKELKGMMPNKKLVIILDEKNVGIQDIDDLLDPCVNFISMVRIAISPNSFDKAIPLAKAIKEKGFEVGFNIMYMSSWIENKDFIEKIPLIDGLVDYFYMVDSYGGVFPKDVEQIAKLVKSKTNCQIGFHGHDNLEMGLINSITAIDCGCSIIDSTITGMGRGAGNLKTELLMTYFASKLNWDVSFDKLSDVVADFEKLQEYHKWGTNLPYMISGAYSLPQKDVMSWISKRRYSIGGIVNALQEQVIEGDVNSFDLLPRDASFNRAIIIGGGDSTLSNFKAVKSYIELYKDDGLCIIHAGTRYAEVFNTFEVPQFYCLAGNEGYRLQKVFDNLSLIEHKCVLPSKRSMGSFVPKEILNHTFELSEATFTDQYQDSPLAIAIDICLYLSIKNLDFIGFDGYDITVNKSEFDIAKENQYLFDKIKSQDINFSSLTSTKYQIKESSIYSKIK
ncbi:4-hydroxy 2-oxovalerate aldolase [Nonlabens dokdonensis]|jgi:4-hydroxy 2-oxovalerate aldolase|uniref:4-hydroxy 2-oxovalerate aldolase n=2 Tax=Nonlabens dokdonensis TaxID=328515 RepID=A0ABX5PWN6_9FLAO|nr:aldolase catalytic domain-containing protein [Nonlabens dokdonensis]AGC78673.1 putative HMGL-like family protein [Nonlabens dokdonensis DSW-6]PZX39200.1 4-hydroxy 2-oxovalerate aldolase [Nonlabens dokdonensis]